MDLFGILGWFKIETIRFKKIRY